jgi:hypothetical protein
MQDWAGDWGTLSQSRLWLKQVSSEAHYLNSADKLCGLLYITAPLEQSS